MKTGLLLIGLVAILSLSSFNGEKNKDSNENAEVATSMISGNIIDEVSGETLVGVEVRIEGTDKKTYTDFDGNFVFENISVGEYSISAKMISYNEIKGQKIDANITCNKTLRLKMNQAN